MSKSKVIDCKGVSKSYTTGNNKVEVLHDIDLEVYSGEYVILFGPSGCGKSTLLNIVAGLEPVSTGSVKIRGDDITKYNQKQLARQHRTKIGMVFQQFNLIKSLNVLDNISLPQVFSGLHLKRRVRRAEHLLEIFGFSRYRFYNPNELSGGQQQRVAIARALVNNPWIMLIDEPTGNLDSRSADEVMSLIRDLNEKSKRTILLVTHNPEYITHPNRVLYMRDGRIIRTVVNRAVADDTLIPAESEEQLLRTAALSSIKEDEDKKDQ
ncbi:MAG: ABC transporter ATP-binding protein [Patescibacteria group bacterium]|jgi:putative ABC transport system ATP-binding protein